jgi:plasmid stabilization system protein ParE
VNAASWYDGQSESIRNRFLQTVETTLAIIEQNPNRYQRIFGQVRRVLVRGFPYVLLYVVSGQEVNVFACFHCSRNPQHWQSRLR